MVDRILNYGRDNITRFLRQSMPFTTVVDLGAGIGEDLRVARLLQPQARLWGVECNEPYIQTLKDRGIAVVKLNIENEQLPFNDGTVDVVIANQFLEHAKEIFWIFHEASRVLRVHGSLIIGVPNLAALHNRLLLLFGHQPSPLKANSAHIRGFTKPDMLRFLQSCWDGYALVDFRGSNFYPFPPLLAKPLAFMFPSFAWGIFFLFKKEKDYAGQFLQYPGAQRLETNFWIGRATLT